MSVDDHTLGEHRNDPAPLVLAPRFGRRSKRRQSPTERPRRPRTRLRKLRLLAVLGAFAVLAVISAVFGMLMSVASDLPQLENKAQFSATVDSYLYDDTGQPIGVLAPPTNQHVLDDWHQISPNMVDAIVAVEDKRFWTDPGVDLRGLIRAAAADLTGSSVQGASTIAEQFVKNVQEAENNRTILEKLREAGLAFQLVASLAQVEDPDRVPEHDLFRQRRVRDRVRGSGLLRQEPRLQPGGTGRRTADGLR